LPRLGLRWSGFWKVQRQVIKGIARRIRARRLGDLDHYRRYLQTHEQEWQLLDRFRRIAAIVRRSTGWLGKEFRSSSTCAKVEAKTACAAGARGAVPARKPYSLALAWAFDVAPWVRDIRISILATEIDPVQIARAQQGCYPPSSLRELPPLWCETAFVEENGRFRIRPEYRQPIRFAVQDLRQAAPDGPFHLILSRNLAFTYFSGALQEAALRRIGAALTPGGMLMILNPAVEG